MSLSNRSVIQKHVEDEPKKWPFQKQMIKSAEGFKDLRPINLMKDHILEGNKKTHSGQNKPYIWKIFPDKSKCLHEKICYDLLQLCGVKVPKTYIVRSQEGSYTILASQKEKGYRDLFTCVGGEKIGNIFVKTNPSVLEQSFAKQCVLADYTSNNQEKPIVGLFENLVIHTVFLMDWDGVGGALQNIGLVERDHYFQAIKIDPEKSEFNIDHSVFTESLNAMISGNHAKFASHELFKFATHEQIQEGMARVAHVTNEQLRDVIYNPKLPFLYERPYIFRELIDRRNAFREHLNPNIPPTLWFFQKEVKKSSVCFTDKQIPWTLKNNIIETNKITRNYQKKSFTWKIFQDEKDCAQEKICYDLLKLCGVNVPKTYMVRGKESWEYNILAFRKEAGYRDFYELLGGDNISNMWVQFKPGVIEESLAKQAVLADFTSNHIQKPIIGLFENVAILSVFLLDKNAMGASFNYIRLIEQENFFQAIKIHPEYSEFFWSQSAFLEEFNALVSEINRMEVDNSSIRHLYRYVTTAQIRDGMMRVANLTDKELHDVIFNKKIPGIYSYSRDQIYRILIYRRDVFRNYLERDIIPAPDSEGGLPKSTLPEIKPEDVKAFLETSKATDDSARFFKSHPSPTSEEPIAPIKAKEQHELKLFKPKKPFKPHHKPRVSRKEEIRRAFLKK